ncbi:MAG: flagellar type III secretion system protein FliQ [Pseudomonadales bacterium]|uniref:Flagellar biosynthetic protein FliQ n=1 Tax=Oleiphilus messinensis TaxID=141451 RepID=A0A1Y0IBN0_9GAMM|nr:flagellar biosynthetic protein FliQ [Oleiphilus messinensis]ARU57569.1 flagellar biosynthetic protein FliQ [Oleiphilus messinensis]MCG8613042.1 flagellar type III secretion system protein FliQ [Pseudomonadales bacterium]
MSAEMMMIDTMREGLFLIVVLVTLIITPSLIVGLIVSVFQAATSINEQTLSFLPRLLITILLLVVAGPWIMQKLVDFTRKIVMDIPGLIG